MIDKNTAAFLILAKQDLSDKKKMREFYKTCELLALAGGPPRHELMFDGYNDDPRRIYQIPECLAVCNRIMTDVPQFIKVASDTTFTVLLNATAVKKQGTWIVNPAWATVLPNYKSIVVTRVAD